MKRKIARSLLTLFLTLGLVTAWGCGEGGGFNPEADVNTDADDDTTTGDVINDGDDDVPGDAPMDVPGDTPTDVETDDGGGPTRTYRPFQALTSGGAKASSTNYELEMFIAPAMPVGSGSSANYNLRVGPAGVRVD